jgi:DNA-dependent RNA polymerase auxiliary subunit epsilon
MIAVQLQCDWCKKGFVWGKRISLTDIALWAEDNGWEMGRKEHICPDCLTSRERILLNIKKEDLHDRVMEIFNRYYRTLHARLRAKTKRITKTQLNIWTTKARHARKLVEQEKYTIVEFIKYLDGEDSEITKEIGEITLH